MKLVVTGQVQDDFLKNIVQKIVQILLRTYWRTIGPKATVDNGYLLAAGLTQIAAHAQKRLSRSIHLGRYDYF